MGHLARLVERIRDGKVSVSVIGLGYVGLSVACVFAWKGFDVYGFDVDSGKVEALKRGLNYVVEEPWISNVLKEYKSRMFFSTDIGDAAVSGDVIIFAVPTFASERVDLDCLISAYETVIDKGVHGKLLVTESTIPPGTTKGLIKPMIENKTGLKVGEDFLLAFSPERIDVGNPEYKLWNVPKVVGGIDALSTEAACQLYRHVTKVIRVSSATVAELVKLMENVQRDVNIALTNLFALLAEKLRVDVEEALDAAATKWNFIRMKPGCGVGGQCIRSSTNMLIDTGKKLGVNVSLLEATRTINDFMPAYTVDLAIRAIENEGLPISDAKVAVLGLGYKKNSRDVRSSPSLEIIDLLKIRGVKEITVYDPFVEIDVEGVNVAQDIEKAIEDSDCVILATDHEIFKNVKFPKNLIVIDGRNFLSPLNVRKYYGIGRVLNKAS